MKNAMQAFHYLALVLGLGLADVETIASIVALVVSIGLGVFSIVIKYKAYSQDGKIDNKELKDLINDVDKLKEEIKEGKNNE